MTPTDRAVGDGFLQREKGKVRPLFLCQTGELFSRAQPDAMHIAVSLVTRTQRSPGDRDCAYLNKAND